MQASMISSYWYGYSLQVIPTAIAKHLGFNKSMRVVTLISATIQLAFPSAAAYSPILGIVMQVIVIGSMISLNFR